MGCLSRGMIVSYYDKRLMVLFHRAAASMILHTRCYGTHKYHDACHTHIHSTPLGFFTNVHSHTFCTHLILRWHCVDNENAIKSTRLHQHTIERIAIAPQCIATIVIRCSFHTLNTLIPKTRSRARSSRKKYSKTKYFLLFLYISIYRLLLLLTTHTPVNGRRSWQHRRNSNSSK